MAPGETGGRVVVGRQRGEGLPRDARVRRGADFRRIQREGIRVQTPAFTIVVAARPGEARSARLGCAVGRRVGGAVVRNRVRRLIKEVFRRVAGSLAGGNRAVDVVVIAKPAAALLAKVGLEAVGGTLGPALERAVRRLCRESPR